MSKLELYQAIAADLTTGEIAFPTSVQLALKLRKALEDPDCHAELAAKLISAEPVLAARVVAVANSVAYNRSGREITDVRSAVNRVGFNTLRSLAMGLATRQLASGSAGPGRALANQLWEHTAHVASLARALARHVTHVDPETAMFAGIVHEIGGFYLLSRAERMPELLEGDFADWVEAGEIEVGRAVLKKLAVPNQVTEAIEGCWEGYLAMPPTSLTDTLLLAEELTPVASPLREQDLARPADALSAQIDMLIGEEELSKILKECSEEIDTLNAALHF